MTVTEIAKLAGVSIGTVDRVLHNRGRVSEATRARVKAIIDQEGYQPNPLARHLKRNKRYLIGVLVPELEKESNYWVLIWEGLRLAAEELSAFSFSLELFTFSRPDAESLRNAFEQMANANCAAWVVAPVMQDETERLLKLYGGSTPYALIDSPLPGSEAAVTVAQNPFGGGFLAGRMMDMLCDGRGPFAVLRPYSQAFNLNERARGFRAWFSSRPGVQVFDVPCPELHEERMDDSLDFILASCPELRGIFGVSAAVHLAGDWAFKRGVKDRIVIVGFDLVALNREALSSGRLDCLISQRPEEQGRHVLHQLYRKIVLDAESERLIEMPFDIFFKENLV
ncbi:LacI family transcriptional regulator [Treponema zuelzerae]|uniref:LacI family transcriptional regulator n=1 Tax=Teretinema zuelzerae TaxID=156 RepID=A0AAE3ELG4_9SPIR|nr:LacI family DNA-binding transcriptional regulator [Teretinema zuelzerae]MCD1655878.1 LacI family transcriptional regulator [Teretinema zuelzerae]